MTLTHLSEALSETCTLERGSLFAPSVLAGVACCVCPPETVGETAALRVLVMDSDRIIQIGWRVVYRAQRFVVRRVSADADGLTELECAEFSEPA